MPLPSQARSATELKHRRAFWWASGARHLRLRSGGQSAACRRSSRGSRPCMSELPAETRPARLRVEASPRRPGARKPETELGAVSTTAVPHPDSRSGPSPHLQGRVMDEQRTVFVGIDVSKDRLDVHLRPSGEAFCVPREGKRDGRLGHHASRDWVRRPCCTTRRPGGFEAPVAAALAGVGLPLCVVNPRQIRDFAPPRDGPLGQDRHARRGGDRPFRRARARPQARPLREPERVHLAELVGRRQPDHRDDRHGNQPGPPSHRQASCPRARATSPISRRSSTRSTTTSSATPSSIPQLGAKPRRSRNPFLHRRRDRTDAFSLELPELGTVSRHQVAALVGASPRSIAISGR